MTKSGNGRWTTTSLLPHEIVMHAEAGVHLVCVSAGMVMDAPDSWPLLQAVNEPNVARSLTRRILIDGQVLLVGGQPVSSLPPGDLTALVAMVVCLARLDGPACGCTAVG